MRTTRFLLPAAALAASMCLVAAASQVSGPATAPRAPSSSIPATPETPAGDVRPACATPTGADLATCMTLIRAGATARRGLQASTPAGYSPADLRSAYNLAAASASAGTGETVAVVDPFDDPNAEKDLAVYRAHYGLGACTSLNGCFRKVNQAGQPSPLPPANASWAQEESLDLDIVSAICPKCNILLVEAAPTLTINLGTAEDTAVSLGAKFVTNGWRLNYIANLDPTFGKHFDHPGVAITAPDGDWGYYTPVSDFPASSQYVTAVGGTELIKAPATGRGWTETAWALTGSGCAETGKPGWQTDTLCPTRTANDVSADADPNPGLAYYDTYSSSGWSAGGGTGAAAAIIAGVYALAGDPTPNTYPSSYPYRDTGALYDITSGTTNSCTFGSVLCTAGPGYDGPTGWGTPDGTAAFTLGTLTKNIVTVLGQVPQLNAVGKQIAGLQMDALDSDPSQTLTYSATGLPTGLSIDPSTGEISGTPAAVGTFDAAVTATDGTRAQATVRFPWYTRDVVSIIGPENLGTFPSGSPVSVQVDAADSDPAQSLTYAAAYLPPGLSINPSSGLITGTLTKTGYGTINVTVSDPTGATATAGLGWTVYGVIHVANPGSQTNVAGSTVSLPVDFSDTAKESVYVNLINGPPDVWPYQSRVVSGWPTTPGVYNANINVADGYGGDDSATFTWTVTPAPDSGPTGLMRSAATGTCLYDTKDSSADGTVVGLAKCGARQSQHWTFVQDGTLRIHGQCASSGTKAELVLGNCADSAAVHWQVGQDGQFLDANASANNLCLSSRRAAVSLSACTSGSADEWIAPAGPIVAGVAGKCLDNSGGRSANGNKIQIWGCDGRSSQHWTMEPDGTVRTARKCLDVARPTARTALRLWTCDGAAGERWNMTGFAWLGGGSLINRASGLCVADPRASMVNGTAVRLGACQTTGYMVYGTVWRIQ